MDATISSASELCATAHRLVSNFRYGFTRDDDKRHTLLAAITGLEALATSLAELNHVMNSSVLARRQGMVPGITELCVDLQEYISIFEHNNADTSIDLPGTSSQSRHGSTDAATITALKPISTKVDKDHQQLKEWASTVLALEVENVRNIMSMTMLDSRDTDAGYDAMDIAPPPHLMLQRHVSESQMSEFPELPSPSQPAQSPSTVPSSRQRVLPSFSALPTGDLSESYKQADYTQPPDDASRLFAPGPVMQLIRSRSNQSLKRGRSDD